jgi:acylpyruvate hydrolase
MRIGLVNGAAGPTVVVQSGDRLLALPSGLVPLDLVAILNEPTLRSIVESALPTATSVDADKAEWLVPIAAPGKIICVGLNYADHAAESPYEKPDYPVYFLRVNTSMIAHNAPLIRPRVSDKFDYEGELVAVIGKGGRAIPQDKALDHVVAYSLFNDGSVRDYQFKGPQWTLGKNFDGTGPFGPMLVSADELPPGGKGLKLETILNGQIVQSASTDDLLFPVAEVVAKASEAMTLEAGDIIVTGTPAGVGFARKPPLFMKHGDVCEVRVERVGSLRNPVRDEVA